MSKVNEKSQLQSGNHDHSTLGPHANVQIEDSRSISPPKNESLARLPSLKHADGLSVSQLSPSTLSNLVEVRKRREEERNKQSKYFKDAKQAMIAKQHQARLEKTRIEIEKEVKRKSRHHKLQEQIQFYRQEKIERRQSIDGKYQDYINEKTQKRQVEIKDFLKKRRKELEVEFDSLKATGSIKKERSNSMRLKADSPSPLDNSLLGDRSAHEKYLMRWEAKQNELKIQSKVTDQFNSLEISQLFKLNEKSLIEVYNYYAAIDFDPYMKKAGIKSGGGGLQYRNFLLFLNHIHILGLVIDIHEIKTMYKFLTKGRLIVGRFPVGITFDQFKEALFRIGVKFKDFISKGAEETRTTGSAPYLRKPMQFVDIYAPDVHLYNDISKEKDEYPDLATYTYKDLDNLFAYLNLPRERDDIINLLDKLRKDHHLSKPDRVKIRPMKEKYDKLHDMNEIIRSKREPQFGPSRYRQSRKNTRMMKDIISRDRREWGLRNKSRLKSRKGKPREI